MNSIILFYLSLFITLNVSVFAFGSETKPKPFVVVLDAGHGGADAGAGGKGFYEKNIALDIILKTGAILEKHPNVKVIYTRKTDVFIPLNERADIANKANADLFVSVHCNSASEAAYGTETFVLGLHANERNFNVAKTENAVILLEEDYKTNYDGFDPNSPESVIGLVLMQEEYLEQSLNLAALVQNNFTKELKRYNRGVKQAGFLVLHRTFMPSVLIETGFISNSKEGKYLNSNKGKLEMANSIADAIKKYHKEVQISYETPSSSTTVVKTTPKDTSTQKNKSAVKKVTSTQIPQKEIIEKPADNEVVFKIQIAAGSRKVETSPSNFKGLNGVTVKENKGIYKYYYGTSNSYDAIKKTKKEVIDKGYSACFIVAFKQGKSIPLSKAVIF